MWLELKPGKLHPLKAVASDIKATAATLLQPTYPAATRNIAGPTKAENKSCDKMNTTGQLVER